MKYAAAIVELIDMLSEHDRPILYGIAKRFVIAWDPDFTKLTPSERAAMQAGEDEEGAVTLDEYIAVRQDTEAPD